MKLFQHQKEGMALAYRNFKSSIGFIMSFSMGLGKTLTAIMTYRLLRRRGLVRECLVVIPRALIPSWKQELSKYFGKVQVYKTGKKKKRFADIVITTYDLLKSQKTWDDIMAFENPMIICDEVHDYCARTKSGRFQALYQVRKTYPKAFFLLLTGTPIRNKPEDLYSLLLLTAPKLAGQKVEWAKKFCIIKQREITVKTRYGAKFRKKISLVVGYKNQKALKMLLKEVMLIRTKEECLDLPKKTVVYLPYELEQTRARYVFAEEESEGFAALPRQLQILSGSA